MILKKKFNYDNNLNLKRLKIVYNYKIIDANKSIYFIA